MKIIDGHAGEPHINGRQIADTHIGFLGDGDYVLPVGNEFKATKIDNNTVQIEDGVCILQGVRGLNLYGEKELLEIENGNSGTTRNDLIVVRYELHEDRTESIDLIVVQGEDGGEDPDIYNDTILRKGNTLHDMPLYRVHIQGTKITSIDSMFTVRETLNSHKDNKIYQNFIHGLKYNAGSGNLEIVVGNQVIQFTSSESGTVQLFSLGKFLNPRDNDELDMAFGKNLEDIVVDIGANMAYYSWAKGDSRDKYPFSNLITKQRASDVATDIKASNEIAINNNLIELINNSPYAMDTFSQTIPLASNTYESNKLFCYNTEVVNKDIEPFVVSPSVTYTLDFSDTPTIVPRSGQYRIVPQFSVPNDNTRVTWSITGRLYVNGELVLEDKMKTVGYKLSGYHYLDKIILLKENDELTFQVDYSFPPVSGGSNENVKDLKYLGIALLTERDKNVSTQSAENYYIYKNLYPSVAYESMGMNKRQTLISFPCTRSGVYKLDVEIGFSYTNASAAVWNLEFSDGETTNILEQFIVNSVYPNSTYHKKKYTLELQEGKYYNVEGLASSISGTAANRKINIAIRSCTLSAAPEDNYPVGGTSNG